MANPTKYQPSYSFTGWQASNPSRPLPAQRVDIEFQNLRLTTDEIIVALAEIRRSDGKLSGGIVDLGSLSEEVRKKLGGGGGASGPIAISDVTGLQTALDGKSQAGHSHAISAIGGLQAALDGKETTASKGQPGGYASLGPDGKVPAAQLPTQSGGADAKEPVYFTKTDTLTSSKLFSCADQATDVRAQKLVETTSPFNGNYAGGNISAFHVRHVAEGTERNGPRGAARRLAPRSPCSRKVSAPAPPRAARWMASTSSCARTARARRPVATGRTGATTCPIAVTAAAS